MKASTLVAIAVLVLWAGPAAAFDQQRKGFVLGLGGGFSPYAVLASTTDLGGAPVDEGGIGFAAQFVIGFAWNESNWLVYDGNVVSRTSETYDTSYGQGINGVSWYHAFGPRGRSWIAAVGAGFQIAAVGDYFAVSINGPELPAGPPYDNGFGVLGGVGYEFRPRTMVMMYGTTGSTRDSVDEFRQSNLSLMLTYLWD